MTEKEKQNYLKKCGIDVDTGLKYADDLMEFYEELIRIFIQEYEEKKEKVKRRGAEYTVLVHGLKNNARSLGAHTLANLAYEQEKASKANDNEAVEAGLCELCAEWEKTVQIFRALILSGQGDTCVSLSTEGNK